MNLKLTLCKDNTCMHVSLHCTNYYHCVTISEDEIQPFVLTFSSLFPIFFPLPLPDRNVRTRGVFSLVFTIMVASPCRPFSAFEPLFGNECPGYGMFSFPGTRVFPRDRHRNVVIHRTTATCEDR